METHPDVVCALDWPCNLLELANQVVAGLVNALLQGNGVGASCHSLQQGHSTYQRFYRVCKDATSCKPSSSSASLHCVLMSGKLQQ